MLLLHADAALAIHVSTATAVAAAVALSLASYPCCPFMTSSALAQHLGDATNHQNSC